MSASSSSSQVELPLYSPSVPTPLYSFEPQSDEQRIEFAPRHALRPRRTGKFVKRTRDITLVLDEQTDGARLPDYGRGAVVRGAIGLQSTKDVIAVTVKLEGRLTLTIAEGGTCTKYTVSESFDTWKHSPHEPTCPSTMSFLCPLPTTYRDDDRIRPLPPSYHVGFPGVPGLFVEAVYTISVIVKKTPQLGLLRRRSCLKTPITYNPRTRPHRPVLPSDLSFFSTIKPSPEEWHQVQSTMKSRASSKIEPIDCNLFIPSVEIFALSDTIPFHIQLRAPLPSLEAFLPPIPRTSPPNPSSFPLSKSRASASRAAAAKPTLRVFLLRQISVQVRGQKAWRNCVLGEGTLRALPPRASPSAASLASFSSLDWEGEVRCENVDVGGFNAGDLVVKDFIVLGMAPPHPQTSPLVEHQHAHPIRLVTDPWSDAPGMTE